MLCKLSSDSEMRGFLSRTFHPRSTMALQRQFCYSLSELVIFTHFLVQDVEREETPCRRRRQAWANARCASTPSSTPEGGNPHDVWPSNNAKSTILWQGIRGYLCHHGIKRTLLETQSSLTQRVAAILVRKLQTAQRCLW